MNLSRSTDYVNAAFPTPVFNTPEIPFFTVPLKKDHRGFIAEIETIALPGTPFRFIKSFPKNIVEVETPDYPSITPLFIDERFLSTATPPRNKTLPSSTTILHWLESVLGTRYFWGGNWKDGIPEMLHFYPHLSSIDQDDALCRGVDCSGLLYQATQGFTPRNTSDLIHFGEEISPENFLPLDLIVWKGHVVIVFSKDFIIESLNGKGVIITPFEKRFSEIQALGKELHFRRWYSPAPRRDKLSLRTT